MDWRISLIKSSVDPKFLKKIFFESLIFFKGVISNLVSGNLLLILFIHKCINKSKFLYEDDVKIAWFFFKTSTSAEWKLFLMPIPNVISPKILKSLFLFFLW